MICSEVILYAGLALIVVTSPANVVILASAVSNLPSSASSTSVALAISLFKLADTLSMAASSASSAAVALVDSFAIAVSTSAFV